MTLGTISSNATLQDQLRTSLFMTHLHANRVAGTLSAEQHRSWMDQYSNGYLADAVFFCLSLN